MHAFVRFIRLAALAMIVSSITVLPVHADFDSGQTAWDGGDVAQAVEQWRSGADGGDARSMLALGRLYRLGVGLLQDDVTAYMWLNLAAARGNLEAVHERNELVETMTVDARAEGQRLARVWQPGMDAATGAAAQPGSLPPEAIREAQGLLAELGYELGPADGIWGARSAAAYRAFLHDAGLPASNVLTLQALLAMHSLAGRQDVEKHVGETFRDCTDCPEMVVLPEGSFMMGSPPDEKGRDRDEGPQHRVEIGYSLAVGRFEVTVAEWDACAADRSCDKITNRRPTDDHPVIDVSWKQAQAYLAWLKRKTGEDYRLLTEAEWEYAARAGTTTAYYTGSSISENEATYGIESSGKVKTSPVGSYRPNAFGLHDMHGNVWEWVADCYRHRPSHQGAPSYEGAPSDGSAWISDYCDDRVMRGGSWDAYQQYLRSASRQYLSPNYGYYNIGFRVARTVN